MHWNGLTSIMISPFTDLIVRTTCLMEKDLLLAGLERLTSRKLLINAIKIQARSTDANFRATNRHQISPLVYTCA